MKKIILFHLLFSSLLFTQWQADYRLTNDPAISYVSENNARCISSVVNFVHAVWYDYRNGDSEIYYKRSTDDGVNWIADIRLTTNIGHSWYPAIAINNADIHVFWSDLRDGSSDEIYYKKSSNSGFNWSSDYRLTNQMAFSQYPSAAVSGNNVHVVWQDMRDGNWEIYYKRSSNAGISWSSDIRLTNQIASSKYPCVTTNGTIVIITWDDQRDGSADEIYSIRSTNNGLNWLAEVNLSASPSAYSQRSSVICTGSFIHAVWGENNLNNWEIYYKKSSDAGISWGSILRLTNAAGFSQNPNITISGSFLHLVWWDDREGDREIFYKRSTNNGTNWDADTRLTNSMGISQLPSVSASGSILHVMWQDLRDGNFEIYYKRNPNGNITGITGNVYETPSEFILCQNYPNPFNPVTNIEFNVPKESLVKLSIYDISGKLIEVIVNDKLTPGSYKTDWNASAFSSGVYFYKLEAEGFTETKKMLLFK